MDALFFAHPVGQDGQIFADDAPVARQQRVAVAQGEGGDGLVEHAAADQAVIAAGEAGVDEIRVVAGDPAETQTRQRKHLGHAADGNALVVEIDDGFAPVVRLRQVAVDLVAENIRADLPRHRDDGFQRGLIHQRAGRVVRVIQADQARIRFDHAAQLVQIGQKAVLLAQREQIDLRTEGLRNGIKLLIRRQNADHVVAGADKRVHGQVVRARRAVGRDDLVRVQRFEQVADAFAQFRLAHDIAVGQAALAERVEKRLPVFARQFKQLVKRDGVDAGFRDIDFGLRFVGVHPFFDFEGADIHKNPPYGL